MIALNRLGDGDAIESDVTLTEQGVEEIIGHDPVVRKIYINSRGTDQFTTDLEFDIEIDVRVVIDRYKKFQIVLINGGDRFVRGLYRPEHRRLYRPVHKNVKHATDGRYLRRGIMMAAEE